MKILSPIFLRTCEFHAMKMGLNRRANPLQVSVAFHGLVSFNPVKITRYDGIRFEPSFIGWGVPLLDVTALRNGEYPFIFNEDGTINEEVTSDPRVRIKAEIDTHLVSLELPLGIKNGDIILASSRYPARELF